MGPEPDLQPPASRGVAGARERRRAGCAKRAFGGPSRPRGTRGAARCPAEPIVERERQSRRPPPPDPDPRLAACGPGTQRPEAYSVMCSKGRHREWLQILEATMRARTSVRLLILGNLLLPALAPAQAPAPLAGRAVYVADSADDS